jgi:hypothetical protein
MLAMQNIPPLHPLSEGLFITIVLLEMILDYGM